jgi:hypothetical protein
MTGSGPPEVGWEPLPPGFCWAVAATLTIIASIGLTAALVADRNAAGRLVKEGGVVETVQVLLFGACGVLSGWRAVRAGRRNEPVAPGLLLAWVFTLLVVAEQDVDVHLFGVRVVHTRYLVDPAIWLPYRAAALLVLAGVPLALALYGLRHLGELWRAAWRGLGEARVWLAVAGAAIFGVTEIYERRLTHAGSLPRYFLEETLELIAGICLFVAFAWPPAAPRGEPMVTTPRSPSLRSPATSDR